MTEAEWVACDDPRPMLEFLRDKGSDRKVRLFAVACCSPLMPLIEDPICRTALEVTDRFANDEATKAELEAAIAKLHYDGPWYDSGPRDWETIENIRFRASAAAAIYCASGGSVIDQRWSVTTGAAVDCSIEMIAFLQEAAYEMADAQGISWKEFSHSYKAQRNVHAQLLRCVFGPLLYRLITRDPSWLTTTVVALAQPIYNERSFETMPILADALEDAGCTHADMLNHCRQPGEHVRGCWVVDLLLNKS